MWAAVAAFCCSVALATSPQASEVVTQIQIHGNTATPDEEIRRLAGVEVGMRLEAGTIEEIAARLRASKKFESVQVLKRFASIADPSQILLVVIVDEGAVKVEMGGDPDQPSARVVRTRRLNLMVLPILYREDGYGFTYGALLARAGVAGAQSRLSFPLTWGGEKKGGIELDKTLSRGPIDRVLGGGSLTRRENPFFHEDDDRARLWVRGERELAPRVRAGATAGWQRVSFFDVEDRFSQIGADIVVDTRIDPILARNAVYARASWERLGLDNLQRTDLEGRGYLGLVGQTVLAVRAQRQDSNGPQPGYLKSLLGGVPNLRGFAAGTAVGDTLVAASAELIVPLTSPLDIGKIGVSAFIDTATVYDDGARLSDQRFKQGYGGTLWIAAAFLRVNVAVAHGRGSSTRVHVGGNVSF